MQTNESRHREICEFLNDTFIRKNRDYGDSFHNTYKRFGIASAAVRMSDKFERFMSLAAKPDAERLVADESIRDTLLDLANYAMMTVMEMDKEKEAAIENS